MGEDFAKNLGLSYKLVMNLGLILSCYYFNNGCFNSWDYSILRFNYTKLVSIYKGDNLRKTLPHTAVLGCGVLISL